MKSGAQKTVGRLRQGTEGSVKFLVHWIPEKRQRQDNYTLLEQNQIKIFKDCQICYKEVTQCRLLLEIKIGDSFTLIPPYTL